MVRREFADARGKSLLYAWGRGATRPLRQGLLRHARPRARRPPRKRSAGRTGGLALQWHPDRNAGDAAGGRALQGDQRGLRRARRSRKAARVRSRPPGGRRRAAFATRARIIFRDLFADPRASDVFEDLVREFERIGVRVDRRVLSADAVRGRAVVTGGVFVVTPLTVGGRSPATGARGHARRPSAARDARSRCPQPPRASRAPRRGRPVGFSVLPEGASKARRGAGSHASTSADAERGRAGRAQAPDRGARGWPRRVARHHPLRRPVGHAAAPARQGTPHRRRARPAISISPSRSPTDRSPVVPQRA